MADSANVTTTADSALRDVRENPAFLVALGFMVVTATAAIVVAGRRIAALKREHLALRVLPIGTEFVGTKEAAKFPLTGSCVLFGLYVAFKFLPREYINMALSVYLILVGLGSLAAFVKPAAGASIPVGIACCAVGAAYAVTKHWMLNNVLAFGICVVAIENIPIKSFTASALLLCGLFVYDVFWVFGTDVMVTVAKNVEGPIKILFPQNVFGDHTKKSLLGLGDIVIPGLFVAQMLRMSLIKSQGAGTAYYRTALVAYVLALLNTMFVMVAFDAAQPALLYIVPWLLITAMLTAAVRGEFGELLAYDEEQHDKALIERARKQAPEKVKEAEEEAKRNEAMGFVESVVQVVLGVFGLDKESKKAKRS